MLRKLQHIGASPHPADHEPAPLGLGIGFRYGADGDAEAVGQLAMRR